MKRIENKLVLFDYGGILEQNFTWGGVYDCTCVVLDAIKFATGLKTYGRTSLSELDKYVYKNWSESGVEEKLFTGCVTTSEMLTVIGEFLSNLVDKTVTNGNEMAIRFLDYVTTHNKLINYNHDVAQLQRNISKKCRIGVMTNISGMWSDKFNRDIRDIDYDIVWESYRYGCQKPNKEAFASVEKLSGLSGTQILFFDDKLNNVEAARKCGWYAVMTTPNRILETIEYVTLAFLNYDTSVLDEFK